MGELVRWLANVTKSDVSSAGGKGANLGELIRAGFPVPKGFVTTTDAYGIAAREARVDAGDPAAARAALATQPVPREIAGAVRDAYRGLGSGRVAVRSSATA